MSGAEQTSWWFDQGKWVLGGVVTLLIAWRGKAVWENSQTTGLAATVVIVNKHEAAIEELKDSVGEIRGDTKAMKGTLDKVEAQGQKTNDGMNQILGELRAHNGGSGRR